VVLLLVWQGMFMRVSWERLLSWGNMARPRRSSVYVSMPLLREKSLNAARRSIRWQELTAASNRAHRRRGGE
jgi:hypothetical protein